MSDNEGEEDFEYEMEEDDENQGGDDEGEYEVENKYYSAKADVEENPKEAFTMLCEVVDLEKQQEPGKWTFKALKQMVKCLRKLKRYDEMMSRYRQLLAFDWSGLTRAMTEKAITKCLDAVSGTGPQVLRKMYEITLEAVSKDGRRQQENIWFNIKLKLASLLYETKSYQELKEMVGELKRWCRDAEGKYDVKKGTQLLTVYSLEIQMYTDLQDLTPLRTLYHESLEVQSAIPPPRIMGIIRECGAKMFMRQENWEEASSAFFQAFKNYDEAGHPRRIQCLKYLVLANMLSRSTINPFDSTEAKPYKSDPEIVAMTDLVDAFSTNDIKKFERVLRTSKKTVLDDPFINDYLGPLLKTIRTQVLIDKCKPYTRMRIAFISEELSIPEDEVEQLLIGLILDNRLVGFIDQINGLLHLGDATKQQTRYAALQKWSGQISSIHGNLCGRIR